MCLFDLKTKLKCCACEGSLHNSKRLNMFFLMKIAKWPFPTWGNALLHVHGFAEACICDDCLNEHKMAKFAVEWDINHKNIKYHPIEQLKDIPEYLREMIEPTGFAS